MNKLSVIMMSATLGVAISGCSNNQWHIKGTIEGADKAQLILESANPAGKWIPIDTIETSAKGNFKLSSKPIGHPEIFRLTLNGQSVYFPIDSIETVTLTAQAANFEASARISGSEDADNMQMLNQMIDSIVSANGEQAIATDPDLKRRLAEIVLRNPSGLVAYYALFRRVGNTLLFDPTDRGDLRLIGAVANAYAHERPNDPRTAFLAHTFISNRRAGRPIQAADTLVATQISLPEIVLLNEKGESCSLTQSASHGKVVIVNFTAYEADNSPAYNIELAKIYNELHPQGLDIYQISVDDDEFFWKEAAKNLPWTTVYASPKSRAETLMKYNVGTIPTLFIINRNGELVERVESLQQLPAAVKRYL